MTLRRTLPHLLLAGVLCAAGPARATLIMPLDLTALTDGAEQVALARVERTEGRRTADDATIYTEVTLRVLEPLKGAVKVGEIVTLRREGGEVDGEGVRVIGAASFREGEEVVVFLERRAPTAAGRAGAPLYTVGMAQGKLHVDVVQGRKMVFRRRAGLSFAAPAPVEPAMEPLDDLLGRIRERVAQRSMPAGPPTPTPAPTPALKRGGAR